ncbi:hypothetical protein [Nannocystis punicea]|uniref:Tc1-like transposase DDE domain-containing protein n=1 Tax=Nannocystis punicea TaxID=2995304 RepID=A0ABY7GY89_9BACT|nr:hypothetical protein [Nannocystis poenicansa]WAS91941.1 hypothetical protein O0S08_37650 [Nannocystis poenicansa]
MARRLAATEPTKPDELGAHHAFEASTSAAALSSAFRMHLYAATTIDGRGRKQLIESYGAAPLYLPPTLPTSAPIDLAWSKIKALLSVRISERSRPLTPFAV